MIRRNIEFDSPVHTYVRDLTPTVQAMIDETRTQSGLVVVGSRHTTMGIIVHELDEEKLRDDLVWFSQMMVPEDVRSTWVTSQYRSQFPVTERFTHNCMDNPRRSPDEIDQDHNAARHIRALLMSHPSVVIPVEDGVLDLGKYQQIAAFEFDGRDGTGVNPLRKRTVVMRIQPDATPNLVLPSITLPR